jgi:hypothetical protein
MKNNHFLHLICDVHCFQDLRFLVVGRSVLLVCFPFSLLGFARSRGFSSTDLAP